MMSLYNGQCGVGKCAHSVPLTRLNLKDRSDLGTNSTLQVPIKPQPNMPGRTSMQNCPTLPINKAFKVTRAVFILVVDPGQVSCT